MGSMPRREAREAESREEQARLHARFASTLVIAAAIIVAVRLAREEIASPSPRVVATVRDSIDLARTILKEVLRRPIGV